MLQKFILGLLIEAAKNPEIRDFVMDLFLKAVKELKADLLPDLMGTFPAFGASLLKSAFELLPNVADLPGDVADLAGDSVKQILESDPDIPGLSDIIDLSELARRWLR